MLADTVAESARLLSRLAVQGDGADGVEDAETVIDAFTPQTAWKTRARVTVQLAQRHATQQGADGGAFDSWRAPLRRALQAEQSLTRAFAVARLLSTLYTFAAKDAHALLLGDGSDGVLPLLLERLAASKQQTSTLLALVTTELLSQACSHKESRVAIAKATNDAASKSQQDSAQDGDDTARIVEIDEKNDDGLAQHLTPLTWLTALVERAEVENPAPTDMLSKVAMLAALTLHKLTRTSANGADQQPDVLQGHATPTKEGEHDAEQKRQEEDDAFLLELCKRHVILGKDGEVESFCSAGVDASTADELARVCQLAAVEGLSYLSLQSNIREILASDSEVLAGLGKVGQDASQSNARLLFPQRADKNGTTGRSAYELDKAITSSEAQRVPDVALQYGVASILANIMAYPPAKDNDQEQMNKLRRMASARAAETTEESDERMTVQAVEQRIASVIDAGCIVILTTIALTRAASSGADSSVVKVNSSAGVRRAVGAALLSATTRQDKRQRGKIVQQGGARALLAINNHAIATLLRKDQQNQFTAADLIAMQALAHLLITENPTLVLSSPMEAVPVLAMLYLHEDATLLQRFEAALALTNVSSLSPELAERIAKSGFARTVLAASTSSNEFVGADRDDDKKDNLSIASVLRERILLEDNEMSRRASLELLCNLVSVEDVYRQWSGEIEDGNTLASKTDARVMESRAAQDLTFLIALCTPAGIDEVSKESSLKLRLAASAVVATLCSSASACTRLLAFESRILNKLSRLIEPKTGCVQVHGTIVELEDEEDAAEDATLHEQDIASDPLGPVHGQLQLAMRGLACVECLTQYVEWVRGQGTRDVTVMKQALISAGFVAATKKLVQQGVQASKTGQEGKNAGTQGLLMQITKQALGLLKIMQTLGILDST